MPAFLSDRQEHAGPWPFARVFVAANLSVNCRYLAVNSSRIWTTLYGAFDGRSRKPL